MDKLVPRNSEKSKLPFSFDHIEGWLSAEVAELLYEKSSNLTTPGCIVEIGSWKGRSTVCLTNGAKASRSHVYAVDPHTGSQEHHHLNGGDVDTYSEFIKNISEAEVSDLITPLRMSSRQALEHVKDPIAMLWIDGCHEYASVKADFDHWFPRLIPGGWILFHDSKWPGVRQVLWEELFPSKNIGPIGRVEDTTFAQKLPQHCEKSFQFNQELLLSEQNKQQLKREERRKRKSQSLS